ncbi:MAG: hypothetical protein HRT76_13045 [Halieaceae bacterium]|nr:hypothetical protein [Halieaceae bacterium]
MSSARAQANQSLYLARIQLQAWASAQDQGQVAINVLLLAFAPAVRTHLLDAFGAYALHILNVSELPEPLPHHTDELPSVASGKAVPAEIREFQQLERSGWLGRLQQPLSRTAQQRRVSTNLAAPAIDAPDLAALSDWAAALEQLMGRMNDSLDEC